MKVIFYSIKTIHLNLDPNVPSLFLMTFCFFSDRPKVILSKGSNDCDRVPVRESKIGDKNPEPAKSERKSVLQSLLTISEGKDFSFRDSSIRNLFVSCRFMGSGALLTSQICWEVSNPNFHFRHSIPVELDRDFLENCCKSNFLILEVWSFFEPKDKLVGVATIPLNQIYVAYQVNLY